MERENGKNSGKKINKNLKGVIMTVKICKVVVKVMIVVELKGKKYPIFKLQEDMSNYKWDVGIYFTSKSDIKETITSYVIQNGRDLKFKKNDKKE